jgi:hypothetical protein
VDRKDLRAIAETLERIATDRSLLENVPAEERQRFLKAIANVYHPDRVERRRMAKVVDKQRRAARVTRDDGKPQIPNLKCRIPIAGASALLHL